MYAGLLKEARSQQHKRELEVRWTPAHRDLSTISDPEELKVAKLNAGADLPRVVCGRLLDVLCRGLDSHRAEASRLTSV